VAFGLGADFSFRMFSSSTTFHSPSVIHASYIVWFQQPKQQQQPSVVVVAHHLPSAEPSPPAYLQHQHDLEAALGRRDLYEPHKLAPSAFTEAEIRGDEVKVIEMGERFGARGRGQQGEV
jgi:hypothetical protein